MTDAELDTVYTTLAETVGRVGEEKTALYLATLALAVLAELPTSQKGLTAIAQAESATK